MKKLIFVLLFAKSCSGRKAIPYSSDSLSGNWCLLQNQVNYPELIFKGDSGLILKSKADTIYFFKYYLEGEKLIVLKGSERVENEIVKLAEDSLIFSTFMENGSRQHYYKCTPKD